ncbi:MAG: hypothetical protein ABI662_08445 [Dermatophilaceae bacterium]
MINTSQQVGASLGTALLNTVAVTTSAAYLSTHEALGRAATPDALTEGYTEAFAVGAGFLLTAAIVAFFMLKVDKEGVREEEDAPVSVSNGSSPRRRLANRDAWPTTTHGNARAGPERGSMLSAS